MLKPIHPYGPVQDLSVIQETNAYCWVDIVVDNADAWVRFEGDGASSLADPSFAAKAGETNHVVILIGKTYKVTCDMPFTVVVKSDPSIDEWWEDGNTLWLNWPVDIWARGDDEDMPLLLMGTGNGMSGGSGFTMHVRPSGLVANDACSTNVFVRTDQRFELEADGTARVSKFGWTGERGTNDTHRVYEDIGI